MQLDCYFYSIVVGCLPYLCASTQSAALTYVSRNDSHARPLLTPALTFEQVKGQVGDEGVPPLAAEVRLAAVPVGDLELREATGEVDEGDGDDLRLPLEAEGGTEAAAERGGWRKREEGGRGWYRGCGREGRMEGGGKRAAEGGTEAAAERG